MNLDNALDLLGTVDFLVIVFGESNKVIVLIDLFNEVLTAEVRILITQISAIIVQITFVRGRDASTVVTRELVVSTGTISTVQLITTIRTLLIAIAPKSLE